MTGARGGRTCCSSPSTRCAATGSAPTAAPRGLTPTLDGLAAAGVRVTRAFSHAPMTLPAHASILTGRIPAGPRRPEQRHLPPWRRRADPGDGAGGAGYRTGAFVGAFVLDARYGLVPRLRPSTTIATRRARRSTFAYRRAARRRRRPGRRRLDPRGAGRDARGWRGSTCSIRTPPTTRAAEYRAGRAPYDAEVAYADAMLGRLIERLRAGRRARSHADRVTADHGESLGDHGETTHGLFAYDATLAVPLILSGRASAPGVVEGTGRPRRHPADDVRPARRRATRGARRHVAACGAPAGPAVYFEALDADLTRGWAPLTGVASARLEVHRPAGARAVRPRRRSGRRPTTSWPRGPVAREGDVRAPAAAIVARARPRHRRLGRRRRDEDAARRLAFARLRRRRRDPRRRRGRPRAATSAADDPKRLVGAQRALQHRARGVQRRPAATTALAAIRHGAGRAARLPHRAHQRGHGAARDRPSARGRGAPAPGRPNDQAARRTSWPSSASRSARPAIWRRPPPALERARAGGDAESRAGQRSRRGLRAAGTRRRTPARCSRSCSTAIPTTRRRGTISACSSSRPGGRARPPRRFGTRSTPDPARGDAWQGLGAALVERDRPAAIDAWRRAERLLPHDYDLLFNLGMVLADGPSPREALPYLERFAREAPRDRYRARHRSRRSRDANGCRGEPRAVPVRSPERRASPSWPICVHAARAAATGTPPPRPCRAPTSCSSPSTPCAPTVWAPTAAPPG